MAGKLGAESFQNWEFNAERQRGSPGEGLALGFCLRFPQSKSKRETEATSVCVGARPHPYPFRPQHTCHVDLHTQIVPLGTERETPS